MWTDNMRVNFNLAVSESENFTDIESVINKPIISNRVAIGVITDAKIDESGLWINCSGVIWDKFIGFEFQYSNERKRISMSAVKLK